MAHKLTPHNYNFVDMTGQTVAGCRVLRRAANASGNACWVVVAACGCEAVIPGIQLRAQEKYGRQWRCRVCRGKRPGTVRRKSRLLTDVQRRILEDFGDPNPTTRHSRSSAGEFAQACGDLLALGWIARGDPAEGRGYYLTEAGKAALLWSRHDPG